MKIGWLVITKCDKIQVITGRETAAVKRQETAAICFGSGLYCRDGGRIYGCDDRGG